MVISTEVLKKLTDKSVKGSGKIPQLAITAVVYIEVKDGVITLTTTDGATNLVVSDKVNTSDSFVAATDSELFSKLVAKTTADVIKLERNDNSISFVGNGAYALPLILDEEGNVAKIPEIVVTGNKYKCKASELKKLLMYNKRGVLKDMSIPRYTGYCIKGGYAYTFCVTGGCVTKLDIDDEVTVLLRPQTVDLFDIFVGDETLTIQVTDKTVCIEGDHAKIYSVWLDGINDFASAKLKSLVTSDSNFPNRIVISKSSLASALDRLSLFISPEEANAVEFQTLTDPRAVILKNKSSAGVETLEVLDDPVGLSITETSQFIDYKDLKNLTDAVKTENVVLKYNVQDCMCIETDGASMFTTYLMSDEPEEIGSDDLEVEEDE